MKKRRRKTSASPSPDEAAYTCPTCGETIIIPLDPSQGHEQEYTEDCPICCHPNLIHVEFFPDSPPRIWAESE